jgi:IclR family acetate operon transcriptional repressor
MATPRNQSVLKAFAMLKSFDSADQWLTNSELSRRANLPEASGYRLIQTLQEIGAVVRGPRGRYRPGMLLVSLSQNVVIPELLHDASQDVAAQLAKRLNVTIHLGILEDGMVRYVTRASTPTSFSPHTRPGCQLEAYCTGLGKILLAALPEDQLDQVILDGELVRLTPYTIVDRSILRSQLLEVRKNGFAVDERETREDMCCVAVPVRDRQGRTIASLSATESAERMTAERRTSLRQALDEAAAEILRTIYPAASVPVRRLQAVPA